MFGDAATSATSDPTLFVAEGDIENYTEEKYIESDVIAILSKALRENGLTVSG